MRTLRTAAPGRARVVLCALLPWLAAACVSAPPHPYTIAKGQAGAPGVETVLLLPLNVTVALPVELEDSAPRVESAVTAYVAASGKRIVPLDYMEGRAAWATAARQVRTGSEDGGSFSDAVAAFVGVVGEAYDFDAVVIPNLIFREARIYQGSRNAVWDGAKRPIAMASEARDHSGFNLMTEIGGGIPGVSLHVTAYQRDGTKVFNSIAGIDVVHDFAVISQGEGVRGLKVSTPLRSERLTDPQAILDGVRMAFDPYLVADVEVVVRTADADPDGATNAEPAAEPAP